MLSHPLRFSFKVENQVHFDLCHFCSPFFVFAGEEDDAAMNQLERKRRVAEP